MKWNDKVKEQLTDYIQTPAVLMSREEEPYEYREKDSSVNRLKSRRLEQDIPYQLYTFLVENGITKNQLREFASGLFLNYIETSKIYV